MIQSKKWDKMKRLTKKINLGDVYLVNPLIPEDKEHCESDKKRLIEIVQKFGRYEDLKEQGLLKSFPCKVGDDIYYVPYYLRYKQNIQDGKNSENRVRHDIIGSIVLYENDQWYIKGNTFLESDVLRLEGYNFGETWFLSREGAEKQLKKLNKMYLEFNRNK